MSALRNSGPGSYLIATQTQVAAMQQTSSYPSGWGKRFETIHGRRTRACGWRSPPTTAVVYTLRWPPGTEHGRLAAEHGWPAPHRFAWTEGGLIVLWSAAGPARHDRVHPSVAPVGTPGSGCSGSPRCRLFVLLLGDIAPALCGAVMKREGQGATCQPCVGWITDCRARQSHAPDRNGVVTRKWVLG